MTTLVLVSCHTNQLRDSGGTVADASGALIPVVPSLAKEGTSFRGSSSLHPFGATRYLIFFIHARIGPDTVWSGVSMEKTSDMWLSSFK